MKIKKIHHFKRKVELINGELFEIWGIRTGMGQTWFVTPDKFEAKTIANFRTIKEAIDFLIKREKVFQNEK